MRYLGSKESLTDSIKELLHEHNLLQRNYIFFDAFCGMGSVADSMKSIYDHIIINDSLKKQDNMVDLIVFAGQSNMAGRGFQPVERLHASSR